MFNLMRTRKLKIDTHYLSILQLFKQAIEHASFEQCGIGEYCSSVISTHFAPLARRATYAREIL
jgi:hypothetical protein